MEFKMQFGRTTHKSIKEFEEKINFKLPTDYESFLLVYNGGIPLKNRFLINKLQGFDSIDLFFGLSLDKDFLNLNYQLDYYEDRFPPGIIPIGEDPGGNYICLDANQGENYGRIYFYDHEVENEYAQGNPTRNNLFLVAINFGEFLKSLQ
ncbi:SMI1/KNR4 family protein [Spirosoma sp. RP8]|uniref:SMI1/KNR4 family protein n=1 Tax=Spirosoma liriopis TaxID=2937440 RepID=A0ABT0HUN4_9BACT|nr:SMI1/KNR4 family protein [Spirosoma liriopis]MCK8495886.1 SMI1/KNR4 family protein [Spirosoma liriopis]